VVRSGALHVQGTCAVGVSAVGVSRAGRWLHLGRTAQRDVEGFVFVLQPEHPHSGTLISLCRSYGHARELSRVWRQVAVAWSSQNVGRGSVSKIDRVFRFRDRDHGRVPSPPGTQRAEVGQFAHGGVLSRSSQDRVATGPRHMVACVCGGISAGDSNSRSRQFPPNQVLDQVVDMYRSRDSRRPVLRHRHHQIGRAPPALTIFIVNCELTRARPGSSASWFM